MTAVLAWSARGQAATLKQELSDAWAREWAAQRPVVYPVPLPEWTYASEGSAYRLGNARVLPIKNGGRGPAFGVHGEVHTRDPRDGIAYDRQILAGTLGVGDALDARLVPHPGIQHWLGAVGVLRYHDLVGDEWQTRFRVVEGPGNEMSFEINPPVTTAAAGEPELPPADWNAAKPSTTK